jgi:thymidylate kinase
MAPFKGLIVEGTSGVGKSTLIDALIRRHVNSAMPRKIRSLIHLAQSHTYGPLAIAEDNGTLTAAATIEHEQGIVSHLEWLHASVQEHTKPWCFVIVDTLHLTHCVRPGVVDWKQVEPIDHRLAALGCRLLFLQAGPQTLWERGIVPRRDQQFLREYARKFGSTEQEIHQYFIREQQTLADMFRRSAMPKSLINIDNDESSDDVVEKAFQFWTSEIPAEQAA